MRKYLLTLVAAAAMMTSQAQENGWQGTKATWEYDLAPGTKGAAYTGASIFSVSNPLKAGFLASPTLGNTRVGLPSKGKPGFLLTGEGKSSTLKMMAPSEGAVAKFSGYQITESPVTSYSFSISFNQEPNDGLIALALGSQINTSTAFNNSDGVPNASTPEIFTELRWEINPNQNIRFTHRQTKGGDKATYPRISSKLFNKGTTYQVEVYCNNSTTEKKYQVGNTTYTLPSGKFNIWVDGKQIVSESEGKDISATELERGKPLDSFLFAGNASTLPEPNSLEVVIGKVKVTSVK